MTSPLLHSSVRGQLWVSEDEVVYGMTPKLDGTTLRLGDQE